MKKNPGLRAKRDQHKAYGKLICVAPDEVDSDSDDGGEAVRIFNSVLGAQPSACMIRVEREDGLTPAAECTSTMVLRTDGDDYEFELLTEDEMLALAEMNEDPLLNLDDLGKLPDMSDASSEEPTIKTEDHQNMRHLPEKTSPSTGETESDVTDDLIAILPAPQVDDLEASNLGD